VSADVAQIISYNALVIFWGAQKMLRSKLGGKNVEHNGSSLAQDISQQAGIH
jgi:hypothetical protein